MVYYKGKNLSRESFFPSSYELNKKTKSLEKLNSLMTYRYTDF